ncbi:acyl-CoA carboxylase subunit epsilon [Streptomyces sp. NPDC046557]
MSRHDSGRFIRLVRGRPDADELAALTAVVLAHTRRDNPAAARAA